MRKILLASCFTAFSFDALAAGLELHRVMLSAAGIGYFEYGARVDGNAALGLDVKLGQVDDVLNSLAVFDSHGAAGSIELPGRDNVRQAFDDVPFTADTLNSSAALLTSLLGEGITVAGPAAMTGRIVGAEPENEAAAAPVPAHAPGPAPARRTRVTLLTADGLRQFILEEATSVQLTDPALRARVGAALDAARQQSAASQRHITLRLTGAGARDVAVGYVAAAPLWKATYRVVLPEEGADHARVQGWAVLENQSGADWNGVDLTLQSGNPVTFHQAIYASYYVQRPEVPVEVLGRLLPNADERGVEVNAAPMGGEFKRAQYDRRRAMFAESAPPPPMAAVPMAPAQRENMMAATPMAQPEQSAEAAATVVGATFHIATPIDLPRGHTASVPIIDRDIPAEQLDWLQAYATRPVTALRITNDSATALPAGVLTLYAQAKGAATEFSCDARLSGLPAGENRLLGFAEDLQTRAERSESDGDDTLIGVKLAHGVLTQTLRHRHAYTATLTAPVHAPRRVLVEFPKNPNAEFSFEGSNAQAQDATATAWRVLVSLAPNETRTLHAFADTTEASAITLLPNGADFAAGVLLTILNQHNLSAAARSQLQSLADLRATETDKQAALQRLTEKRDAVLQDEDRLRKNLDAVTTPGNLRDKLLAALDADESTLADLRQSIAHAQADADAAHAALAKAVETVTL